MAERRRDNYDYDRDRYITDPHGDDRYHRIHENHHNHHDYHHHNDRNQQLGDYQNRYAPAERHHRPRPVPPKDEKIQERNLYEWGKWRTTINDNIINDVMTNHNQQYPSIDRLVKTKDGAYVHGRSGRKVKGDPSFVMNYSLSTNQVTELSPEEFLAFGIPRVRVASTESQRHSNFEQVKSRHHYPSEDRQHVRDEVDFRDHRYTGERRRDYDENNHQQPKMDRNQDSRYNGLYRNRKESPARNRVSNQKSPPNRDGGRQEYDDRGDNYRHHRGQTKLSGQHDRNKRHDYQHDKNWPDYNEADRRKDRSNDYHRNKIGNSRQDMDDGHYENTANFDTEDLSSEGVNSVVNHDNTDLFTPRTDYTTHDETTETNKMPESIQKVFERHTGAHKPVKVFPDPPIAELLSNLGESSQGAMPPPPVIPLPPPPPPIPADKQ